MGINEDEYLHLSGITQFLHCRRYWALIHIEQQYQDGIYTNADQKQIAKWTEKQIIKKDRSLFETNMRINSNSLGIVGMCEIVEFLQDEHGVVINGYPGYWKPVPIILKNYIGETLWSDEMQLLAQAMCLEEMMCCEIEFGQICSSYDDRMVTIEFDNNMREIVRSAFGEMHKLMKQSHVPRVKMKSQCASCLFGENCSLALGPPFSFQEYLDYCLEVD